ncbi:glycosyltransferase family 1 protein [Oceanimonas pelagia]|uniref:Glycosyltransferase family 1 protein n=1 Tax=Oceanimonas pelagia TaxID=3028314 RepID=A0AA50KLE4_9GAMM|nr:glycosyltransferase family 1 protein [Oceanimonas pelagia]WMC09228.1 glycosyltransferase family 1 protein [Oceanimonas pelagia]
MPRHCYLVEEQTNPSSGFFLWPWLQASGHEVSVCRLNAPPPVMAQTNSSVIFVRYLTPAWRKWVENNRAQLGRLAFFMDDDLFDLGAHAGLPLRYRYKLWLLACRHKNWLQRMGVELWVSTPWLAEKYARWSPQVLQPQSPYTHSRPQKTLFYHGSASHGPEFEWLYPVFEQVLAQDASLSVELIGSQAVRKQFAGLPKVHVLHPMSWPAYQALLARPGRTIGLAPLLNSRFNAARAPTKFFDITQAGAVGLYADHPVYRALVRHEHNGLLLPMVQQAWVNAILRLSADDKARQIMMEKAKAAITKK